MNKGLQYLAYMEHRWAPKSDSGYLTNVVTRDGTHAISSMGTDPKRFDTFEAAQEAGLAHEAKWPERKLARIEVVEADISLADLLYLLVSQAMHGQRSMAKLTREEILERYDR